MGSTRRFDIAVVGGGSAGCVVAARLSENPDCSVVLLEAGHYYPTVEATPPEIRFAENLFPGADFDWGFTAVRPSARATPASQPLVLWRGKVMGGSSAINGAGALRALPSDFDRWVERGLARWSYDQVLPYFRKLETDMAPDDRFHGRDGPMRIVRYGTDELIPSHAAFIESSQAVGHPFVEDHNLPGAIGVGPLPMNSPGGIRLNTALAYLSMASSRPNLEIRPDSLVDRIATDDGGATGVWLHDGTLVEAAHVVLSAGSLASPAILLRSGIGPADDLRALGIPVIADRSGVGRNLQDHPCPFISYSADASDVGPRTPAIQTILTLASNGSTAQEDIDLHISMTPVVEDQLMFFVGLLKPLSIGSLTIRSTDPQAAPIIDTNFYDRSEDLARLVEGFRVARAIASTGPTKAMVGSELVPGTAAEDDEGLAQALIDLPFSYQHASGSCRMGDAKDAEAVVDDHGTLLGVDGISVIDASIFPLIPSTPTNMTTIMVAERCADDLKAR